MEKFLSLQGFLQRGILSYSDFVVVFFCWTLDISVLSGQPDTAVSTDKTQSPVCSTLILSANVAELNGPSNDVIACIVFVGFRRF